MRPVDFARLLRRILGESLPVPVEHAPNLLGVTVELADLGAVDGMMSCRGSDSIIILNRRRTMARRRFTLAHELGHIVMGGHPAWNYRLEPQGDRESAANRFAGELLMPGIEVRLLWDHYRHNPQNRINLLCERLLVSRRALEVRLRELDIAPWN